MRMYVMTIAAVAALGLVAAPTAGEAKKKSFAQKLGRFAKGVANVGLQVAGRAPTPAVRVQKKTFGKKLGGIDKGSRRSVTSGAKMYPYTVANVTRRSKAPRKPRLRKRIRSRSNVPKRRADTAKNSIRNIN